MNQRPRSRQQGLYQPTEEDYYDETEYEEYDDQIGDASELQVPDARLYREGVHYNSRPKVKVPLQCGYYYENNQAMSGYKSPAMECYEYSTYPEYAEYYPEEQYVNENCNIGNTAYENNNYPRQQYYQSESYNEYQNRPQTSKVNTKNINPNSYRYNMNQYQYENIYNNEQKSPGKKYPVTIKTPKYVTKNVFPGNLSKRPSALCIPGSTQPDPAIAKRRSKTNYQTKKCKPCSQNVCYQHSNHSTHKMNSQGDVKNSAVNGLDNILDEFENAENIPDNIEDTNTSSEANTEQIKEFAKFLKPRVPSSIKVQQEKLANMKPKMKLSLDKLLNRLQKCEPSDIDPPMQENYNNDNEKNNESKETKEKKSESFTYEELTRNCSTSIAINNKDDDSGVSSSKEPKKYSSGPLECKRNTLSMDDYCALDLHKSKSYIVDLIDRALSKELGTVPRGLSNAQSLTPSKAIATISRHQQSSHSRNDWIAATLTDSIISSVSAPPSNQIVERSTSDSQIQKHDDGYIKQLKQLRWGHIRHIQHEARKLADLEEFLEKCGEIED